MATIAPVQFLKIADRLAAQYELFLDLEAQASPSETKAELFIGTTNKAHATVVGASASFPIQAKSPGTSGNSLILELRIAGEVNQELSYQVYGDRMIILLATDGSAVSTTTLADIFEALREYEPFTSKVEVLYDAGTVLAGLVTAQTITFSGGLGDAAFTLRAKTPGKEGNDLTVKIQYQLSSNVSASMSITDNQDLLISVKQLNGDPDTTPQDIKDMIEADYQANQLFEVILYGDGSAVVEELAKTNLSGGLNGPYADTVLSEPPDSIVCQADPDVALMVSSALSADIGITAATLSKGVTVLESLLSTLSAHFSRTGLQSIQNYLTEEDIRVHENFSLLNGNRVGTNLYAVNVFKKSTLSLGTIELSDVPAAVLTPGTNLGLGSGVHSNTNYAAQEVVAQLTPASEKATLTVDPTGANNGLVYTAKYEGEEGNRIFVKYTNPGTANQSLGVVVTSNNAGSHINVNLATNGSSVVTSTATLVKAAIEASGAASALVDVTLSGADTGAGVVAAFTEANLDGGFGPNLSTDMVLSLTLTDSDGVVVTFTDLRFETGDPPGTTLNLDQRASLSTAQFTSANDRLRYLAREGGEAGNDITITYTDPAANNQSIIVSANGDTLEITLATGPGGAITTTAQNIKDAVEADSVANTLVIVSLIGNGTGIVGALAETNLSGGANAKRYFKITAATLTSGGTEGDQVAIISKVERAVTL